MKSTSTLLAIVILLASCRSENNRKQESAPQQPPQVAQELLKGDSGAPTVETETSTASTNNPVVESVSTST